MTRLRCVALQNGQKLLFVTNFGRRSSPGTGGQDLVQGRMSFLTMPSTNPFDLIESLLILALAVLPELAGRCCHTQSISRIHRSDELMPRPNSAVTNGCNSSALA